MRGIITIVQLVNLFYFTTSDDSPSMSGFYTEGLDKVLDKIEIVYPEKVSKDGSFVSYYLPHYYNIESVESRPRRTSNSRGANEDAIHFDVPIDGEKHHLELWPNLNFIAPGLVIERRDARDVENVNKAKISQVSRRQCHYNGQIVGKPNSSAALSTCYGLAGYIRVPAGDEYIIEPVKDSKPTHDKEHPHIMYKRSGTKEKRGVSNCLTKGRAKEAFEERMQWEALYGDQVRKELSGVNINELVQNERNTPNPSLRDKLPLFNEHFPGKEMFNNENIPVGSKTTNFNNLQQRSSFEDELQTERNESPIKNGKLYLGNKIKNKSLKDEINMGHIKFPEEKLLDSVKTVSSKGIIDNTFLSNEGNLDIRSDEELIGNKRSKRDLGREFNKDLKPNNNINGAGNTRFEYGDSFDKNNIDHANKISQRSIGSQCVRSKEQQTSSKTKNTLNKNEKYEDKREVNAHTNEYYRKNTDFDQSNEKTQVRQNSGKDIGKRDQNSKPETFTDQHNNQESINMMRDKVNYKQDNLLVNNDPPHPMDTAINNDGGLDKYSNLLQSVNNKENNIKRETPPDNSERKSQTNRDSESNTQSKSIQSVATDKIKEVKITNLGKEKLSPDDKIMASVLESVVKDIEKPKVKKEVGEGFSSINSNDIYQHQQPIYAKDLLNHDNNKYLKFNEIYLTNSRDVDEKPGIPKTNDNINKQTFIGKETNEELNKCDKESVVQKSQDRTNPNFVDEIVIRIKTPEGTVSDVSHVESDVENVKRDSTGVVNTVNSKDPGYDNERHIQLLKAQLKNSGGDKNKRGINNKLNDGMPLTNKLDEANSQESSKGEKENDFQDFNFDGNEEQIKIENNDKTQVKTKRDDSTIHLIIGTESEINNLDSSNSNPQRGNLFCQGKNCLEIKPIVLNDSNVVNSNGAALVNNTTNTESAKTKMVEKRQAWVDECASETTTERPLLCFDFFSKLFNLELMITVDFKVVKLHDDDDIENFILTIINMVSSNFYDKSIGINLSVVLVRLIILTTCIKELDSDRFNPEELLENFCTWQVLINPGKDDHPHHHDLAIFVTRMDKCEGQIMGVTYMTSICRPDKACLVCVDEGLLLANTITHQIGHSLGADHDDNQSSGCAGTAPDGSSFHMAPIITETSSAWSTCSKDSIIQFVRTQGSWCLTDLPIDRSFNFPLMLPGQIYSAAQQCKLNFHMTSYPCSVGPFCEKLYCQVTERLCATKGDPPADGTFCASDMWCFHKTCVHIGRRPGSVNGEWGPWTEWSVCTRSCGGGVSSSYRICNNPKPDNGGRYCIGDRIRHRMCATKPCQGFTESFRDLQCKKTEDRPFRGRLHNWIQYHSFYLNIECALICQNRRGDVVMRSPIVADGTPCKAGTRNVCIQGVCRNVGCDWVIDSKAKEDACGICHGNSTECKIIQGIFDEPTSQKGLVEFLRIPKDSGMIFVREIAPSANLLVVSGAINRVFYLNGIGTEDSMPGDVSFGVTHGVYEVRSAMERIFIRGPTTEDLIFYVLFREPNKGIHYQYAVPERDPTYVPRYLWQFLDWDTCTEPCSGGSQRAHAKCVEDRGGVVDDQFCTESSKPMDIIRPCNDFPCQAKWWVSVWSDCICTGSASVMFRSVLCMRATDESGTRAEIVKESECAPHKKPPTQKACNATEEENECVKRSVVDNSMFGPHRDLRRAVNPKTAYATFSSSDFKDSMVQEADILSQHSANSKVDKEKYSANTNKNQKKIVKPQNNKNVNAKGTVNKQKPKINDNKELPQNDKRKIAPLKNKEIDSLKPLDGSKSDKTEEYKLHLKSEDLPLVPDKGKQISKFKSKNSAALSGDLSDMKHSEKVKQADDSDVETNSNDSSKQDDKCESTENTTCPTEEMETTEASTCKETNAIQPHKKTTCCKTNPSKKLNTKAVETTTLRPVVVKLDELNMNNFALTVVPLDFPGKRKLPQTDPEFINLGDIGQFGVGDQTNGTIITGQEAIDFLDFARSNASEEPVILHEEMHN